MTTTLLLNLRALYDMRPHAKRHTLKRNAFTLAELLISLAILGVIATFTIPKILGGFSASSAKVRAKDAAAMISGAYQEYCRHNVPTATTKASDILPYMNYVKEDTTSFVDSLPNLTSIQCDGASLKCIQLHTGGILVFYEFASRQFGGTTPNNALEFVFDPDEVYSGSANDGPSKSIQFNLFYDGFLCTRGQGRSPVCVDSNGGCYTTDPIYDPIWFSWN
jgi:prepilin-type N-terminal cleavage/methylation domain-containing protein